MEFQKYPKTKRFLDVEMIITQKLDGTNSQVALTEDGELLAGSRNRWLTAEQDNFGFYQFVQDNAAAFKTLLNPGQRVFGEFCGPKIQNGQGLDTKKFFLFNPEADVPEACEGIVETVPLLYRGPIKLDAVVDSLLELKYTGSKISKHKTPEGIIVTIHGTNFKVYLDQLEELIEDDTD